MASFPLISAMAKMTACLMSSSVWVVMAAKVFKDSGIRSFPRDEIAVTSMFLSFSLAIISCKTGAVSVNTRSPAAFKNRTLVFFSFWVIYFITSSVFP